jgi:hypothetical protein
MPSWAPWHAYDVVTPSGARYRHAQSIAVDECAALRRQTRFLGETGESAALPDCADASRRPVRFVRIGLMADVPNLVGGRVET